jgi:2-methylisocitrate lyase-like PEP mutase family enzyme
MADPALRAALGSDEIVVAPGVFDLISALVADRLEFRALYVTGYGTVASYLGLPDAGLATYRDMLERIARIVEMTTKPVIADADTGYGGLLNVRHTVRGYEAAGVSAIQIEDQEFPKKCGHTPGRRVVPMADMVRKIEVAADSRSSADFLIVARTDARSALGLDEALRRAEAYAKAGADILFVESPQSEAELAAITARLDRPVLANLVNGGHTPMIGAKRLQELGFKVAIYPVAGFLAAAAALDSAYKEIIETGNSLGERTPIYPFADFSRLMGFEDVWSFERRFAQD